MNLQKVKGILLQIFRRTGSRIEETLQPHIHAAEVAEPKPLSSQDVQGKLLLSALIYKEYDTAIAIVTNEDFDPNNPYAVKALTRIPELFHGENGKNIISAALTNSREVSSDTLGKVLLSSVQISNLECALAVAAHKNLDPLQADTTKALELSTERRDITYSSEVKCAWMRNNNHKWTDLARLAYRNFNEDPFKNSSHTSDPSLN